MRYKILINCLLLLVSTLLSCSKNESSSPEIFELKIPQGFPEMTFPSDNEFTVDRWILGKNFFTKKHFQKITQFHVVVAINNHLHLQMD